MDKLSFGIWFPPITLFPEMFDRWQKFEELGFDSLWAVDHFTNPLKPDSAWMEAWTILGALAARTEHIRIGTMVTNIIYRNPALIAKQALTVDHISRGRLTLGIGAGSSHDVSHQMTGVEAWKPAERVDRFREIVEIVDKMLRQSVTTYEGRYYQVQDAVMKPLPVQKPRPKLTIAAHGPKTLRIAAQYADTWNTLVGLGVSPRDALDQTRQRSSELSEYALEQGRDPDSIARSLFMGWTEDKPFASVQSFVDFVGRYHDVGISEFIFGFWTRTEDSLDVPLQYVYDYGFLEKIAMDAIPQLKGSIS